MTSTAVNFEYEWMDDGSLRLRFMNEENALLGQQFVATEGLVPLQLLLSLAMAKANDTDPEDLRVVFRSFGINADFDTTAFLEDAARVRAGITPEGNVGLNLVDED